MDGAGRDVAVGCGCGADEQCVGEQQRSLCVDHRVLDGGLQVLEDQSFVYLACDVDSVLHGYVLSLGGRACKHKSELAQDFRLEIGGVSAAFFL